MKKLLVILAALLILATVVYADGIEFGGTTIQSENITTIVGRSKEISRAVDGSFDLSGLTFDELAELCTQCQAEMMKRDEWQEVTVPQGNYRVGVDIPAGKWVVRCKDVGRDSAFMQSTEITWGTEKPVDGRVPYPRKGDVEIFNPNNKFYKGQLTEYVVELEEGDWVAIDPTYNAAVFTPYTGNTGLGFK